MTISNLLIKKTSKSIRKGTDLRCMKIYLSLLHRTLIPQKQADIPHVRYYQHDVQKKGDLSLIL